MKAIVLTYDKYRTLTHHMIDHYDQLWPDHPFRFRIPYQELGGTDDARHEYVETPKDISATVRGLLADLPDDEWVYWCIDDKYPLWIDLPKVKQVLREVDSGSLQADAVLFCRCRNMLSRYSLSGKVVRGASGQYLERSNYAQIWVHQFLKVKVIRHLFDSFPKEIPVAKAMDKYIRLVQIPQDQRLLVTAENHATFGESTSRGMLTQNCYDSLLHSEKYEVPDIAVDEGNHIVMGDFRGLPLSVRTKAALMDVRRAFKKTAKKFDRQS